MQAVALVTGTSSGLGLFTAVSALAASTQVCATAQIGADVTRVMVVAATAEQPHLRSP